MEQVPKPEPVTTPVVETVATNILLVVQVPPDTVAEKGILVVIQTLLLPLMVPATGAGLTVIVRPTATPPHVEVTE